MTIDKQALREAATEATQGGWYVDYDFDVCHESGAFIAETHGDSLVQNAKFIAAANPSTVLALLDELEAAVKQNAQDVQIKARLCRESNSLHDRLRDAEKRIAELEQSETQLINERDDAESALNDAYKAVMGQAPEWSNWFSFGNAIDEIELACEQWRNQTDDVIQFRQRIQELEAKLETADKLQDSAFRGGLKAGFSYGQTDDQSGFAQCMSAYSTAGIKVIEGEQKNG